LADWTISDLPEGLVVFHGLNEAGKSTLVSLLTTVLYGFRPIQDFPYRSWDVDRYPELRAILRLNDGSQAEVWRKLTTSPSGSLKHNGDTTNLANHALAFVQHISRDLYGVLYALTQEKMRSLKETDRAELEDCLLGGLGTQLLRPTRQVLVELEAEAQGLWRPDRRGKPLYGALREQYRGTKDKRSEAKRRDEEIRGKAERLHDVQKSLGEKEKDLADLNARIRRADLLVPVRRRIQQIERWRSEIPNIGAVEELSDELGTEHRRLCERVEDARERVGNLERDRGILVKEQEHFTDEERRVLESADQVEAWVRRISAHEQERQNLEALRNQAKKLADSLADGARSLFAEPLNDQHRTSLQSVALAELKARIDQCQKKERELERLEGAAEDVSPVWVVGEVPLWITGTVAGLGLLVLVLGLIASLPMVPFLGAVVTALAILAAAFGLYVRRDRAARESERREEIEGRQREERKARASWHEERTLVQEMLGGLPIAPALLEHPDLTLYQGVDRLQTLSAEQRRAAGQLEARQRRWDEAQGALEQVMEKFGEGEGTSEALSRVEDRLRIAREQRHDFEAAGRRIGQIDEVLPGERTRLSEAKEELSEFLRALARALGEDLPTEEAVRKAAAFRAALNQLRSAEQQLRLEYLDLEQLEAEIQKLEASEADAWALDPDAVERSRLERERLQEERTRLIEEQTALRKDIENARGSVSVGELDGEIARLEEEMDEARTQRDRLVLLASVLREADRRFRDKHQPDVLKRASEYLGKVTAGRYEALLMVADEKGEERLSVRTAQQDYRPVEFPLSGGTLDQIHLAFRLAVIDHLDRDHEPLPLLLDEVLINWDDVRLPVGADILSDVAKRRQVFLFTCRQWLAERLREATGAPVLQLKLV
jgi:uncharacterized protein YhaN